MNETFEKGTEMGAIFSMEYQENVNVYPQNVKYKPFSFMSPSSSFSILRMDKPRKETRHYGITVFSSKLTLEPSLLFS